MKHLLSAAVAIFILVGAASADQHVWRKPGSNPCSLGLGATKLLSLPDSLEWTAEVDTSYWLPNGSFLNQLTAGGRKWNTKPVVGDSVLCRWLEHDSLKAVRYVGVKADTTDSLIIHTKVFLYHFEICNNIGWNMMSWSEDQPEPVKPEVPQIAYHPPKRPKKIEEIGQETCLAMELESFNGAGYIGTFPYVNNGARFNWYPCLFRGKIAFSAKLYNGWHGAYEPWEENNLTWNGFSFNHSFGWKVGVGFQLIPNSFFYLNYGRSAWRGSWNQVGDIEVEAMYSPPKWQFEASSFYLADPIDFMWFRGSVRRQVLKWEDGQVFAGLVGYHEGQAAVHPDYYFQRAGIAASYFKLWGKNHWYSVTLEAGPRQTSYFGAFISLGFNCSIWKLELELKPKTKQTGSSSTSTATQEELQTEESTHEVSEDVADDHGDPAAGG